MNEEVAKILREPFEPELIGKLPKGIQKGARKAACSLCNGFHEPAAVHLDYVGHAATTDRLLKADPAWTWDPLGVSPEGLPVLDRNGGLWIRLTVAGVSRIGYGDADGKTGGNAVKEAIGDAIRNAAMRFGVALDLWSKADLHSFNDARGNNDAPDESAPEVTPGQARARIAELGASLGLSVQEIAQEFYDWSQGQQITTATVAELYEFYQVLPDRGATA